MRLGATFFLRLILLNSLLSCSSLAVDTLNDNFVGRIFLQMGETNKVVFHGASIEDGEPLETAASGTLWFECVATSDGTLTVHQLRTDLLVTFGVFTGDAVTNLTPVAGISWFTSERRISWRAKEGQKYCVSLGFPSNTTVDSLSVLLAPGNPADDFANAHNLSGPYVLWSGSTAESTMEVGEPADCGEQCATVWAIWTPPEPGSYRMIRASGFASVLLFTGNQLNSITPKTLRNRTDFQVSEGETLYLRSSSPLNDPRQFTVRLGLIAENDIRDRAIKLEGGGLEAEGATWTLLPQARGDPAVALWWKWVAPSDGIAHFSTPSIAQGVTPFLRVFHSNRPTFFGELLGNTRITHNEQKFYLPAFDMVVTGGTEYSFALGGPTATNVSFSLRLATGEALSQFWQRALPNLFRGGSVQWFVDNTDGIKPEALTIITTNDVQQGWLEAIYLTPGTLSFYYKTTGTNTLGVNTSSSSTTLLNVPSSASIISRVFADRSG